MSNGSDEELPKVWFELMAAISEREGLRRTLPIVEPSAPPEPPYEFHGFEVTGWALGGMGMVVFGRDPKLRRNVALKLLQSSGPKADAALIAEAQTLAKLSHPNVVTIYGVSEWEGGVFFVMEFIDGMNGKKWLEEQPTWQEVLRVFIDAGEGLAAAHDKGIQHGDFKPANMLARPLRRSQCHEQGAALSRGATQGWSAAPMTTAPSRGPVCFSVSPRCVIFGMPPADLSDETRTARLFPGGVSTISPRPVSTAAEPPGLP